jgi:hypothetical protein
MVLGRSGHVSLFLINYGFFANMTLTLKETPNSTKHPKKNENYNEILEKPFKFNLQNVLLLPLLPASA